MRAHRCDDAECDCQPVDCLDCEPDRYTISKSDFDSITDALRNRYGLTGPNPYSLTYPAADLD